MTVSSWLSWEEVRLLMWLGQTTESEEEQQDFLHWERSERSTQHRGVSGRHSESV